MRRPYEHPDPPAEGQGFGHSKKRIAAEVGGVIVGLGLAVWLVLALVSWAAGVLIAFVPLAVDQAIGEAAWEEVIPPDKRCADPRAQAYVEALAAPLLDALESEFEFTFAVVDDPSINAFALPGGFIVVHRGLIEAAESGEEIAAVLAHEIHHVTQRHGMTRLARQAGAVILIGMILGAADLSALTGITVGLTGNAYDRDQEREADALGHALLVEAGINPGGMVQFFDRLAQEGPNVPALLSTHPGSEERAAAAAERGGLDGAPRALPSPSGVRCH